MSDNKENVPKIRFPGFTGAWEQRRLGDLGSVAMNKRIFKDQTTDIGDVPFYKIGTFGGKADAFISRELFEGYKRKYPYPEVGDVLISASGSIGRTVVYQGEDEYFQDSNIVWLKHDERLNNSFLKQFYLIVKWKGLEGSTIKRLYNKNILETEISVPEPAEQQKIGAFFTQLDNLINLHRSKLSNVKKLKAGLLQKMFPKTGEDFPEVRFPGFTDAWEQRELSELCIEFTDGDWIELKDQSDSGVRLVQTSNVAIAEYLDKPNNRKWISEDTFKRLQCKEVLPGDILISRLPEPAGRACIMPSLATKMITAVDCTIVRPASDCSNKFLIQYLSSHGYFHEVNKALAGGTRQRISRSNLAIIDIPIPKDYKEQEAIGGIFSNLDNLIILHQRKLEHLQEQKKALLQQMFV